MGRRLRHGMTIAALGLLLAGCATFPDDGPRAWQPKIEGVGELGGPPAIAQPSAPNSPPSGGNGAPSSGTPAPASGCTDADPQVVATCLNPVGAIAVLPDPEQALVGERTTGRVLQVTKGKPPVLVATVPVDGTGGGGLTGLVLSPSYAEDQLLYAYVTTPTDNRVVRIARGEPAKPVLVGIPRGPVDNGGALAVDVDGSLLVATGDAGGDPSGPGLAGKVLRIDTLGRPGTGNPTAGSPVLSSGLHAPGGICVDTQSTLTWITDRDGTRDVLHKLVPGPLPAPAWTWPDRPGVAGCMAAPGVVTVAETGGAALFVLHPGDDGTFTGDPETLLVGTYGRLSAAALASDGLLWLGTVNKAGGRPVPSDDRVIRIQPPAGGGASAA
ncbi:MULTISPECIES: PQQ-dependent sugar dehydrogenase [unclassified Pseudonocardia]|uniref:PQQ-dependent sugar dehydrogenase n=1 Tax=unclassified Pseudonocardia TaxID=2619320 RepID=UPI0025E1B2B0|nr:MULTISPECIES: PQQ-dependent sugar dehydrogenase [unclassified Pseudonocardia]